MCSQRVSTALSHVTHSGHAMAPRRESRASALPRELHEDGVRWLVYEQPAISYDRRSGASLIFESDSVVRRVRNYPPEWRQLSDCELLALSWTT